MESLPNHENKSERDIDSEWDELTSVTWQEHIKRLEETTRQESMDYTLTASERIHTPAQEELKEYYNKLSEIESLRARRDMEAKYHRNNHIRYLRGEYQLTDDDVAAWERDTMFWHQKEVEELRNEYLPKSIPEVYNPSETQINNETIPYIRKLSIKDYKNCGNAFASDFHEGVENEVQLLSKLFELVNAPKIQYNENAEWMNASFNIDENVITIYGQHDAADFDKAVETIAHEMWHAHQEDVVRNKFEMLPKAASRYNKNREYIFQFQQDPQRYYSQVLEHEAFNFAMHFSNQYRIANYVKNPIIRQIRFHRGMKDEL